MSNTISREAIERMQGLVNIRENDIFIAAGADMIDTLEEDGFEKEEAKAFLISIIHKL